MNLILHECPICKAKEGAPLEEGVMCINLKTGKVKKVIHNTRQFSLKTVKLVKGTL